MAKGLDYERDVASAIEAELMAGNYGIDPACAAFRRRPGYHSRDRNKDIVFDLSIEVTRKGGAAPYLILVWECKNYAHTVPVDDAEEFHAKLSQVGADRTKGFMITPVGYDSGTVEFAKSKGISLWRLVPPGTPTLVMEGLDRASDDDILLAMTTPDTNMFRDYGGFYALTTDGRFTTDQAGLLRDEFRCA